MWRWRSASLSAEPLTRRFSTAIRQRGQVEDEGDWSYSSEWWGADSDFRTNSVFQEVSDKGNGVVSVLAYPCSRPSPIYWPSAQRWLQKRYAEVCPGSKCEEQFRILGYQWRVLRFNDDTRQSTVKVLAASKGSDDSVYLMQQGRCLAVPYLKSMVSAGLTTLASSNFPVLDAVCGKRSIRILCVGLGGGSLPLFLATCFQGAVIDIVEIDPLVIKTSIQAMGFPSYAFLTPARQHALTKPAIIDDILWRGIHERLFLYESDAERFILDTGDVYDIVFIDAYDGEDIFPHKLWNPQSPFLQALANRLHPDHGTVVVNLHSTGDITCPDGSVSSVLHPIVSTEKYVSSVGQAYKTVLTGKESNCAFAVSVPWLYNKTLVVSRGFPASGGIMDTEGVFSTLYDKCLEVDNDLGLPFSCLQYMTRGFLLV